jgi:hypothetical protein
MNFGLKPQEGEEYHDLLCRAEYGRNLFSRGESVLATVEQMDRWLCQPAVIPI